MAAATAARNAVALVVTAWTGDAEGMAEVVESTIAIRLCQVCNLRVCASVFMPVEFFPLRQSIKNNSWRVLRSYMKLSLVD